LHHFSEKPRRSLFSSPLVSSTLYNTRSPSKYISGAQKFSSKRRTILDREDLNLITVQSLKESVLSRIAPLSRIIVCKHVIIPDQGKANTGLAGSQRHRLILFRQIYLLGHRRNGALSQAFEVHISTLVLRVNREVDLELLPFSVVRR
jgi:hypothetical protein